MAPAMAYDAVQDVLIFLKQCDPTYYNIIVKAG